MTWAEFKREVEARGILDDDVLCTASVDIYRPSQKRKSLVSFYSYDIDESGAKLTKRTEETVGEVPSPESE